MSRCIFKSPCCSGGVPLSSEAEKATELLFRFLMTSVFIDNGLLSPCSLKNNPQALHMGCPCRLFLHNGVFCVEQFVQVGEVSVSPSTVVSRAFDRLFL